MIASNATITSSITSDLDRILSIGTQDAWWEFVPAVLAKLTPYECASLAFMALEALNADIAVQVAEAALLRGAGQPVAPLLNHMDEAAFWADMAEPEEVEAYCLASFKAMPSYRQSAFLDFVQGRQAA